MTAAAGHDPGARVRSSRVTLAVVGAAVATAVAALPARAPGVGETFVLVDCAAQFRASVLETSSILEAEPDACAAATLGHGAWQGQLLSRHGDVVRVATIERGAWNPHHECSGGPFGHLDAVLDVYVPESALLPTVSQDLATKTRDGRAATLKPGVPLRARRGLWHRVRAQAPDGTAAQDVEVPVRKPTLRTEFERPPGGRCATVDPPGTPAEPPVRRADPHPEVLWRAPAESPIYLPTREEIGVTTAPFDLPEETFVQGPLRCTAVTPLRFAAQGPAPLCFLELALDRR